MGQSRLAQALLRCLNVKHWHGSLWCRWWCLEWLVSMVLLLHTWSPVRSTAQTTLSSSRFSSWNWNDKFLILLYQGFRAFWSRFDSWVLMSDIRICYWSAWWCWSQSHCWSTKPLRQDDSDPHLCWNSGTVWSDDWCLHVHQELNYFVFIWNTKKCIKFSIFQINKNICTRHLSTYLEFWNTIIMTNLGIFQI